jgi:GNAT superfamily N-acetyltransferase
VATIEPYARAVIREFKEDDADRVAELVREFPWLLTAEHLRHRLRSRPPRARAASWIAEEDGALVGWAQVHFAWTTDRDDLAEVLVFVSPDRRREGFGSRLYELAAGHALGSGAREVRGGAWEAEGHRFLLQRGYLRLKEERFSALDPRTVDTSSLVLPDGFHLAPIAELGGRERDVHALYAEAFADQPDDEGLAIGFDDWLADLLGNPQLSKEGSFVVLDGETPAALAWIQVSGRRAQHDLTGTARAYRRRGLARAAKLATIRWCAEHDIELLATGNDATNVGMLAINDELGFRPWITRHVYVLRT